MVETNNKPHWLVWAIALLVIVGTFGVYSKDYNPIYEPEIITNVPESAFVVKTVTETIEKEIPADYIVVNGINYDVAKVTSLLEVTGNGTFTFEAWANNLFDELESDADVLWDSETYQGDDSEWSLDESIDDIIPDCVITFDDNTDEGTLSCDEVEIETDDNDQIICNIEVNFDSDNEYDDGDVDSCSEE